MAITIDGTNGIATDNSSLKLDATAIVVEDSASPKIEVGDGTRQVEVRGGSTTQNPAIGTYYAGDMTFATNSTERMCIDSSGRVTMPYQPAFMATFGGDGNIGNMDQVHGVLLNEGNHFNSSNGAFTVPVAGRYLFNASVMTSSNNGTSYHIWYFTVNGDKIGSYHHSEADSNSYRTTSGSAVVSLSANDVIRVKTLHSPAYGTNIQTPWSEFSGYLLG